MTISGLRGVIGEGVDLGQRVSTYGGELAPDAVVRDDGEGVTEAGDVPGLAGREQGDGAFREVFREVDRREMGRGRFVDDFQPAGLVWRARFPLPDRDRPSF